MPPSSPASASRAPGRDVVGVVLVIAAVALVALFARDAHDYVARPLARGMRIYSLQWFWLLLSGAAFLLTVAWLRMRGGVPRPAWRGCLVGIVILLTTCLGPLLLFGVLDREANDRERKIVMGGFSPLIADLRAAQAREGRPPEEIAPLLERRLTPPPPWLLEPERRARVRYYRGPERFLFTVIGTRMHRDSDTFVWFSSAVGEWRWSDFAEGEGEDRWLEEQLGGGAQSCQCEWTTAWRCTGC